MILNERPTYWAFFLCSCSSRIISIDIQTLAIKSERIHNDKCKTHNTTLKIEVK